MKKTDEFMKPEITYGDTLRFTPYAYAKLLWMRNRGDTEIAGYCVTGTKDPLFVTDFKLVKQRCTSVSFDLDPEDGAEFMEQMVDEGWMPWQFQRILVHSHPGNSPQPSGTDEKNFVAAFSRPDWAIMLIIAENGETYCRLKFNIGPGGTQMLKIEVDFSKQFPPSDHGVWEKEYEDKVKKLTFSTTGKEEETSTVFDNLDDFPFWGLNEPQPGVESEDGLYKSVLGGNRENHEYCPRDIDCFWDANGNVAYWDEESTAWFYYNPIKRTWYQDGLEVDNEIIEIAPPNEHWVTQIVLWANEYAEERNLAMEGA